MELFKILRFPDNRLRKKAILVKQIDKKLQNIVDNMLCTMYHENGIGLAATQVNIHQRIVVIDVSEKRDSHYIMINPEVIEKSGHTSIQEGCLSIPNYYCFVPRAAKVTVQALNIHGQEYELEAMGLLAICIQHEIDHLNGKLFIDDLHLNEQDIAKILKNY